MSPDPALWAPGAHLLQPWGAVAGQIADLPAGGEEVLEIPRSKHQITGVGAP